MSRKYESFNRITNRITPEESREIHAECRRDFDEFALCLPNDSKTLASLRKELESARNNLGFPEGPDARERQKNLIVSSYINAKIKLIDKKISEIY